MLDVVQRHVTRWAREHGRRAPDLDRFLWLDIGHGAIDGSCYLFGDATGFPRLAAKTARTPIGREVLEIEHANLSQLERIGMNESRRRTPEPLGSWIEGEDRVTLQSALGGSLLKNVPGTRLFSSTRAEATVRHVLDFWYELQDRVGIERRSLDRASYEREVLSSVRRFLGTYVVSPAERELLEQRFERVRALEAVALPWMVRHGDFCTANMVLDGDGGLGVFDWEFPLGHALPLFDLFYFFSSTRYPYGGRRGESDHFTSFVEVLWGQGPLSRLLAGALTEACRRFDLPRDAVGDLLLLATVELANMKYDSFVTARGEALIAGSIPEEAKSARWRTLEDVDVPFARIRDGRLLNLGVFVERGSPGLT